MSVIIANKYKLLEQIGKGAFGSIYKAQNIRTNQTVAIKMESLQAETKLLKNETKIYQYLNGIEGVPSVLWFGVDKTNYYMAIPLLGSSLQNVIEDSLIVSFSLEIVILISIKIIKLLESVHSRGLIHRDVKPDNFLFGLGDRKNQLNIIDFGFCKRYLMDDGLTHIPMRENRKLLGTPNFVSINMHNGIEPSRRDDLESVAYIMLYLLNSRLNWDKIVDNKKIQSDKIKTMNDFRIPLKIRDYFIYCRLLGFDETPNYEKIYNILNR